VVDNQFQLGSCVGNAIANAYELQVNKLAPDKFVELSRLFIYYNARKIIGEPQQDTGTTIRAGLKATSTYGVCSEIIWPYDVTKFDVEPSAEAYADAVSRKILSYTRLYSLEDMLDALTNQQPVVIALFVFSEFMTLNSKGSTLPLPNKDSIDYGGHAVCLVGYDKTKSSFLAKNSFGDDWGDGGYFWLPFEYAERYVFEQWIFDIPIINTLLRTTHAN
jgi:C1A family cysteine protease